MRRGIHTKPVCGLSDDWITPPRIVRALGPFDTDPCAHPEQFYMTARRMIAPPDDGLIAEWHGRVWLNPPYGGRIRHWLARMVKHGDGIALVPARTEVESWFWPFVWEAADAILFLRGRLYFHQPDGSQLGNAGHGSVLAAYGKANVACLTRSAPLGSAIPGRLIVNSRKAPPP
jgi:hypothetical protein